MTDSQIISAIISREGGYVDKPNDAGGPTNWGITMDTLSSYRGSPVTASDVKMMTEEEAAAIYQKMYLKDTGIDHIKDDALRACALDTAVNFGPAAAVKLMQVALGVTPDGQLGIKTLGALDQSDPKKVLYRLVRARVQHRAARVKANPSQVDFLLGWLNRDLSFLEA